MIDCCDDGKPSRIAEISESRENRISLQQVYGLTTQGYAVKSATVILRHPSEIAAPPAYLGSFGAFG
eukprot:1121090-Pleurochrysis_carterae.AAC.1